MSQLLTDWVGPNGMLRRFGTRNVSQLYVGEKMVIKGQVTKKYLQAGTNLVDCTIRAETPEGKLVAEGYATVELPVRTGANIRRM